MAFKLKKNTKDSKDTKDSKTSAHFGVLGDLFNSEQLKILQTNNSKSPPSVKGHITTPMKARKILLDNL